MNIIKMPSAGQTTDEARIVTVNVKPGDTVKRGDVLVEAETDKAVLPVESFATGKVLAVLVEPGSDVAEGSPLVVIGKDGETYEGEGGAAAKAAPKEEAPAQAAPAAKEEEEEEYIPIIPGKAPKAAPAAAPEAAPAPAPAASYNYPAMPGAKKEAKERGIDLALIPAANGQFVKKADVLAYTPAAAPAPEAPETAEYDVLPMSRMRQIIGRRMHESLSTIPCWQCTTLINMDACMALRETYKAKKGVKLSYNDIMAKAIAVASRKFPLVKARFEDGEVRVYRHNNIGLAVALDGALVVPVARNIDEKGLEEIAGDYKALIAKARDGKLLPDEMGCGSLTISNLGMYDVEQFIAIDNPPESCILAVGSIKVKPDWDGEKFVPVHMMSVTGSFDHRIIDGAYGAQFLQELKILMENPELMLY